MRWTILALGLWLASPVAAEVARPESLDDTLANMREAYADLPGVADAAIDPVDGSVRLTMEDGEPVVSYPDNLHILLQGAESDDERQQILDEFTASLVESFAARTDDAPLDPATIVPLVRSADFAVEMPGAALVSDPFVGDIRIFYAFDRPMSFSYVTEDDLRNLGLAASDLRELAESNFWSRSLLPTVEGDGIWYLILDGNFEATFLLNAEIWEGIDEQLDRIIMMPLARDLIFFTDASFEGAADELRAIAERMEGQVSYPLSTLVYEWTSDGWTVR